MKKNDRKSIVSGSKEEVEHFAKILMEKMDSTVKTVTEQYGGIIKKIDSMSSDVSDLKEDIAIMKPALERNCKDVQELKQDMREVKSELKSVKMIVVNISHETNDHEKRIKKVEEKVFV
ncbi:MAG: hypothetical protein Q8O01_07045 [Candidatus Omnitrophota bacterium]|nr:hypothetical protein [Candidatus Omnitrophota bacterium]